MLIKIRIRDLNPHIVCFLCAGYFIEATTITECLHTFCKSCVVKFLQSSKCCPQCSIKIHETQPLMNLKPDRVMQDIVFKLVPGLYENEEKRKDEYCRSHGLMKEQKEAEESITSAMLSTVCIDPEAHYYRNDELLCFCIENFCVKPDQDVVNPSPSGLSNKFVRCSVRACIFHVKKLLQNKLSLSPELNIDIIFGNRILENTMTLKQVSLMQWPTKQSPLMLFYRLCRSSSISK